MPESDLGIVRRHVIVAAAHVSYAERAENDGAMRTNARTLAAFGITGYTLYTTVFLTGASGLGVLPMIAGVYLVLIVAALLLFPALSRTVAASPYWGQAFAERSEIMAARQDSGIPADGPERNPVHR